MLPEEQFIPCAFPVYSFYPERNANLCYSQTIKFLYSVYCVQVFMIKKKKKKCFA